MVWMQIVHERDAQPAFTAITAALDNASGPLDVIVDMTRKPNIPMQVTLWNALRGPFRDKRLREWLCVGGGAIPSVIANVLSGATGRTNIRWFDSEETALEHIRQREHAS
jgi:hypothetical protein